MENLVQNYWSLVCESDSLWEQYCRGSHDSLYYLWEESKQAELELKRLLTFAFGISLEND